MLKCVYYAVQGGQATMASTGAGTTRATHATQTNQRTTVGMELERPTDVLQVLRQAEKLEAV